MARASLLFNLPVLDAPAMLACAIRARSLSGGSGMSPTFLPSHRARVKTVDKQAWDTSSAAELIACDGCWNLYIMFIYVLK